jgi:hypothetical protein
MSSSHEQGGTGGDANKDHVEKIKRDSQEDASAYYAQGDHAEHDPRQDYGKPLPPVDTINEEFNMLKALSFLAVGGVVIGIGFMWFMVSGLDKRMSHVEGTMGKMDEKLAPVSAQVKVVTDGLTAVQGDVGNLKGVVGENERKAKVLELKRALMTIQEVTANSTSDAKTSTLASINALINEYSGEGGGAPTAAPAPSAPAPAVDEAAKPIPGPETAVPVEQPPVAVAPAPVVGDVPPAVPPAEVKAEATVDKAKPAGAGKKGKKAAKDDDDDDDDDK